MLPPVSVNKRCCSHWAITLQPPWWWALRELRIETGYLPSSSQQLQPPRWCIQRLRMRKHRILVPDSWGAYQRNDFSEPRLLHLPIYRKVNSLTWDVWFSLINRNLLMFWLLALCCKNSYASWFLPRLFRAVPQSSLRGCIPGLSHRFVHWIEHNSQLLGCAFFWSTHPNQANRSLWLMKYSLLSSLKCSKDGENLNKPLLNSLCQLYNNNHGL